MAHASAGRYALVVVGSAACAGAICAGNAGNDAGGGSRRDLLHHLDRDLQTRGTASTPGQATHRQDKPRETHVVRVALTGGPCAGKSSALEELTRLVVGIQQRPTRRRRATPTQPNSTQTNHPRISRPSPIEGERRKKDSTSILHQKSRLSSSTGLVTVGRANIFYSDNHQ